MAGWSARPDNPRDSAEIWAAGDFLPAGIGEHLGHGFVLTCPDLGQKPASCIQIGLGLLGEGFVKVEAELSGTEGHGWLEVGDLRHEILPIGNVGRIGHDEVEPVVNLGEKVALYPPDSRAKLFGV